MLFPLVLLMTNLYFLVPATNTQIFNPTSYLEISTGALTNEAKAEIKFQPLTTETKIIKSSKQFKDLQFFMLFTY